jgi:hypothetical protein
MNLRRYDAECAAASKIQGIFLTYHTKTTFRRVIEHRRAMAAVIQRAFRRYRGRRRAHELIGAFRRSALATAFRGLAGLVASTRALARRANARSARRRRRRLLLAWHAARIAQRDADDTRAVDFHVRTVLRKQVCRRTTEQHG